MLTGKDILVIGARSGGYGESIARSALKAGARVFGTSLNPNDSKEQAFFKELGVVLVDVPLRFDVDRRQKVFQALDDIGRRLKDLGVERLDAIVHTVAGGFPRQPSVMKSVGDILKGKQTFFDLATAVKRNVYYVNSTSFEDSITGLAPLCDADTQYVALTYRGDLPYFIWPSKQSLEKIAVRSAKQGKRTLIAALPEAWTQSSQFFTGIEVAVMNSYMTDLACLDPVADEVRPALDVLQESLSRIEGWPSLLEEIRGFVDREWQGIGPTSNPADLASMVADLFADLRSKGTFPILRRGVEIISDFVREVSAIIVVRDFLAARRFEPGDVRQVYFRDLGGMTPIGTAVKPEPMKRPPVPKRDWVVYERDEIHATLNMYGDNFLFLDRVVLENGEFHDGMLGFGRFTVPTPERNPILRDHFIDMPLFGGHLQMEMVAQFGTFILLKLLKDKRLIPILTGTEFPDMNTMAPPGESLTMMGAIHFTTARELKFEAFIENRYARSKGVVRGMVLNQRLVRKILASFNTPGSPVGGPEEETS